MLGSARKPLLLVAALMVVWLLVAFVVAPLLLPRLSPGSALADGLAGWRARWWDGLVILLAFAAVAVGFVALRFPLAARVPAATAQGLGAIRMWIAMILLGSVLWEDLASSAYLPRGMLDLDRMLSGLLHALPLGYDRFLESHAMLSVFEGATALLLLLAAVGLFTRWTVPAAALAYLLFAEILRSYAWSFHMGVVPLYALLLLSFTPCGDGWSLDRWRRRRSGQPVPPAREPRLRYALGRYLVWMSIALPYTMAGLSKIRRGGLLWADGENMKQMVVGTIVEPMHFGFELTYRMLTWPDWIFDVLGVTALAGEVLFVLVLVSRIARLILPALTAAMHVGILLMQNILFPDLIAIQAVFYDWGPLRDRVVAPWRERRRLSAARSSRSTPAATTAPSAAASAAASAAMPAGAQARRIAGVARWFAVVMFVVWATRTEKFPFTAMQMFSSRQEPAPVQYVTPVVVYEDGTRAPARFEEWIGVMADSRYRRLIRWDAHPDRIPLLREFLDIAAARAAASEPAGPGIERFELELRRWAFRDHPGDPDRGQLLGVLRHRPAEERVGTGGRGWTR